MTTEEQNYELLVANHAALDDPEAADFLIRALDVMHRVDDLVDEHTTAEAKIATVIAAMDLYVHPFFLKHPRTLYTTIHNCASVWADSVAWEQSEDPAQREWAEMARHAGIELYAAVADIKGGWAHRTVISREMREHVLREAVNEKLKAKG